MDELLQILNTLKPGVDFTKETDLVKRGILDSLTIITLVNELKDEFDIEITLLDIVPKNFFSAQTIYDMVERLQEK